jgi:pseudaminic acid biosynthesis-associated methylase
MDVTTQVRTWQGDFGRAYTDRNVVDPAQRLPAFRAMLEGVDVRSVLEVGCNRGHNLVALTTLLGPDADVRGLEPNTYALDIARAASDRTTVARGAANDIPFNDATFDLVFTSGVLIHVALETLPTCLDEIHRVARRYILAIEYFANEETGIEYRGHHDLLWKRDFLRHYTERFPSLALVRSGYWDLDVGFDRTHWWLLEKPTPTPR